jgi:hypothetical protein
LIAAIKGVTVQRGGPERDDDAELPVRGNPEDDLLGGVP